MIRIPDDLDDQSKSGSKFADGLLLPIFAVAAVFLFIVLCFYAYNNVMKNKDNDQVVVLDGDNSDFKVTPENPGGMEVEHTDKAVFNTVTGQMENTEGGLKVESTENPVSQEQLAAEATGTTSEIPVPATEGETSTVTLNSDGAASDNDENTRSVTVAEDESPTVPTITNTSPNTDKLEVLKSEIATAANEQATDNSASEVKAPEEIKIASEEKPIQPEKIVLSEGSKQAPKNDNMVKAEVKKETDKKTGESKTVVNFKEMPKSMKKAPASVGSAGGSGAFYVQVSSHSSRSEAEAAWSSIKTKYSAEIGGNAKNISEATVKGKTYYRLSFGPFSDRGAASTKCGILKAKGQDCIIQRY